jgi:hypothetical protein
MLLPAANLIKNGTSIKCKEVDRWQLIVVRRQLADPINQHYDTTTIFHIAAS